MLNYSIFAHLSGGPEHTHMSHIQQYSEYSPTLILIIFYRLAPIGLAGSIAQLFFS